MGKKLFFYLIKNNSLKRFNNTFTLIINRMKLINFFSLITIVLLLSGCILTNPDSTEQIIELQKKYFVENGFTTNQVIMSEYVSALAELKTNSSMDSMKLIEAEIFLAESFTYYNKALSASEKISFPVINCHAQETKEFTNFVDLATKSVSATEEIYLSINSSQKEKLRDNYFELLSEIKENVSLMKEFIQKKC